MSVRLKSRFAPPCSAVVLITVASLTGVAASLRPATASAAPSEGLQVDAMLQLYTNLAVAPEPGTAVAISADGKTALVGDDAGERGAGTAWVFTRSGNGTWTTQARLQPNGPVSGDAFGCSVALSADGNTALIGAPGRAQEPAIHASRVSSSAEVFARNGETWTQQATFTPVVQAGHAETLGCFYREGFGASVALSGDGRLALVGAPGEDRNSGAMWAYKRSGSTWAQEGAPLVARGITPGAGFGQSIAISGDGSTALVGAPANDPKPCSGAGPAPGGAWVFTRGADTWAQQGRRLPPGGRRCWGAFGSSVALSDRGDTALVAGGQGALVLARSGSGWARQAPELSCAPEPEPGPCDGFTLSVALSGDGREALIGAEPILDACGRYMNEPCRPDGRAWAFARFGATWVRQEPGLANSQGFGYSVALSSSGESALIGEVYGGSTFATSITSAQSNCFNTGEIAETARGALKLKLVGSAAGVFTATARVSTGELRLPHGSRHRLITYGTGSVKVTRPGVVAITIRPTPMVRSIRARHMHLELEAHLSVGFRPRRGPRPSRQVLSERLYWP